MNVISIVNKKGGVGKTTSAINISAELAKQGKRVLLVDVDPQSNLTNAYKCDGEEGLTVADVLINKEIEAKNAIRKTEYENINILTASKRLGVVEKDILLDVTRSQQNRLRRALEPVQGDYDYCIIDCPPALNIVTINALVASDEVLVPIKIDKFAIDGIGLLSSVIKEIKEEFNPKITFKGYFITMDKNTNVNKGVKKELKKILGDKLYNTTIRDNVSVTEASFEEKPVVDYKDNCLASVDYKELVKEVF